MSCCSPRFTLKTLEVRYFFLLIIIITVLTRYILEFPDLQGTTNPMLNLLAWCFTLKIDYSLEEKAQELESATKMLKNSYSDDIQGFNNVLTFLLCLRDLPKKTNNILVSYLVPHITLSLHRTCRTYPLYQTLKMKCLSTTTCSNCLL